MFTGVGRPPDLLVTECFMPGGYLPPMRAELFLRSLADCLDCEWEVFPRRAGCTLPAHSERLRPLTMGRLANGPDKRWHDSPLSDCNSSQISAGVVLYGESAAFCDIFRLGFTFPRLVSPQRLSWLSQWVRACQDLLLILAISAALIFLRATLDSVNGASIIQKCCLDPRPHFNKSVPVTAAPQIY